MCVLYLPFCYVIWEEVETVTYFIFLGFKIPLHGDCSHEIQRCLFLGGKAMINLEK